MSSYSEVFDQFKPCLDELEPNVAEHTISILETILRQIEIAPEDPLKQVSVL